MIFTILIISIVLLGLLSWYVYKESTGFVFKGYTIFNDKIKTDEVKIALISDLHNVDHGNNNEAVLKTIDDYKPHFICFAGDIVNASLDSDCDYTKTLEFIKKLSEKYEICYGIGNHEDRLDRKRDVFKDKYDVLVSKLKEMGVPLMDNTSRVFEEYGLKVYGLNLDHDYYRKFITKSFDDNYLDYTIGHPDEKYVNILIAHNPEHFKQYSEWGADVVFSGHVHGGIIRIPYFGGVISPAMKLFPKYDGGLFSEYGSVMILSRGLGTHSVPVRINNKAEVVGVTIKKKDIN